MGSEQQVHPSNDLFRSLGQEAPAKSNGARKAVDQEPPDDSIGNLGQSRRVKGGFLEQLTPRRAFRLFFAALVLGTVLILSSTAWPPAAWLAAVPLVGYGVALIIAQSRYSIALNGTVKDSPYFLGFLLTMIALAKVFMSVAAAPAGSIEVGQIVGEAGGAILATVVGLFFRQFTLFMDRAENAQDLVFQKALRQLREGAVELHKSQEGFAGLVDEFVGVKRRLYSREEAALAKYVARLETGTGVLTRIEEGYPDRIQKLLERLDAAIARIDRAAEGSERQVVAVQRQVAETVTHEVAGARRLLNESASSLKVAREAAITELGAAVASLRETVESLQSHTAALDQFAARYPKAGDGLVSSLADLTSKANSARNELVALTAETRTVAGTLTSVSEAVMADTRQVHDGVVTRASTLKKELEAIDAVVEEFVDVMRLRIQNA